MYEHLGEGMVVNDPSFASMHRVWWLSGRDLSEISRGGGGVTTFWASEKGKGHEKWAVKRGRVMQIYARDHVEVHPQKKKEVLYLAKKREKYNGLRNVMDINCEVL